MMGFSGFMMGYVEEDNDDPTPEDIGRFIPQAELQTWWAYMQRRYPQVFPASDPCPNRQWPKDTKIRTYFDGDRSKELNAIILGSKMKVEPFSPSGEQYPMYVVRCPPSSNELSYIHLTEAHEEDGWKVEQEKSAACRGNASLPSPEEIKIIALEYNYEERRDEASRTLFFKDTSTAHNPTLINIFYTTGGVMTKLSHPRSGYNQLWRTNAYDSATSLAAIFENPRVHTGKGYRNAGNAVRGCVKCGQEKKRGEFSNNQWRKGRGESKCTSCVQSKRRGRNHLTDTSNEIRWESIIDSITCDSEGCRNHSPSIRCQTCCVVYYCSETCRLRHQREHSQECMNVDVFRLQYQMSGDDVNLRSGLCNAGPSTMSQLRGRAMATQLSGDRTVDSLLLQAEYIHQADENWEQALGIYHRILMASYEVEDHNDIATPPQWRQVYMGINRCSYMLGMYDKCISAGTAAVEMNRNFPQVHRYIALAHEANGDHAEAIKTMKHAILYEAPWCDVTLQLNKDLLRRNPYSGFN
ncbi:hypothetical protein ACHAWT_002009 [Skeletonema menzelii]